MVLLTFKLDLLFKFFNDKNHFNCLIFMIIYTANGYTGCAKLSYLNKVITTFCHLLSLFYYKMSLAKAMA